jgi:pyruvate dehydrogenase E2 component (dihydrolipoamide acetyltransferase)
MADVVMPQMGESIVEGTLTRWLKKIGDSVERDEPLFEISTDKVDTEIPSPVAGVLSEVLVEEGKTVGVNTLVARVQEAGGAEAATPPPAEVKSAEVKPTEAKQPDKPAESAPEPAAPGAPAEPAGPLSPLVRKIARENNIDIAKIAGTGAGGRVTKQDLENYMAKGTPKAAPPAPVAASAPVAVTPAPTAPSYATPKETTTPFVAPAAAAGAKTRTEPLSNMRIKIAEHMVASKRISPHVTTVHRVDMTRVAKMRARHKDDFAARYGISLTFLPFVTRATVEALRTFPLLNASIDGTNILYHNEINVGIAVALENGLIVPVIRNADEKNVLGLQRSIVDLAARARSRQLKPDEIQGGTFSITNFGSFGSIFATPIINQPQVAILGIGAVEKAPVVIDDAIAIRSQAYLALTFDHRLVDGALADQFTAKVKQVLESWSEDVL